jgi:hypothetical protein
MKIEAAITSGQCADCDDCDGEDSADELGRRALLGENGGLRCGDGHLGLPLEK